MRKMKQTFYFGPPERRLFGAYHPPHSGTPPSSAALLINPFGQEAVRVHRLYRVVAERLAERGWAVMRFDPYGTGDSAGADEELELVGWADDLRRANEELATRSHATVTTWIAARLGAAVALIACRSNSPRRLLLWEPILDGPRYLRTLRQGHLDTLHRSYGVAAAALQGIPSASDAAGTEAIGFALSPTLLEQLAGLDLSGEAIAAGTEAVVLASPHDAWSGAWRARVDRSPRFVTIAHDFDWIAEEALNTALVPPHVVRALLQHAAGDDQ